VVSARLGHNFPVLQNLNEKIYHLQEQRSISIESQREFHGICQADVVNDPNFSQSSRVIEIGEGRGDLAFCNATGALRPGFYCEYFICILRWLLHGGQRPPDSAWLCRESLSRDGEREFLRRCHRARGAAELRFLE
jgi:hypothetical protein